MSEKWTTDNVDVFCDGQKVCKLTRHSRDGATIVLAVNSHNELVAALEASEREYDNLDEYAPLDPGCIECTVGTDLDRLNRGLCAHHLRVAALSKARGAS